MIYKGKQYALVVLKEVPRIPGCIHCDLYRPNGLGIGHCGHRREDESWDRENTCIVKAYNLKIPSDRTFFVEVNNPENQDA